MQIYQFRNIIDNCNIIHSYSEYTAIRKISPKIVFFLTIYQFQLSIMLSIRSEFRQKPVNKKSKILLVLDDIRNSCI